MMYESIQEVFDIVVNHLLTQNKRAERYGMCVYRTDDGLKCAVGCLIPDDVYTPNIEGAGISNFVIDRDIINNLKKEKDFFKFFDENLLIYSDLLRELQNLHDSYIPSMWRAGLNNIARDFNLKFNYASPEV